MFLGISAASYTNSSISLITKGKAIRSVDLGSVFLCDKNKNLGLYGYPKVDFCGKEHTVEPTKFMGNVLQYFERQAEVNIYVCTYIVIDELCYSRFFRSVYHTKIRKELRTDAQHCRNAKNSMVSPHGHPISRVNAGHFQTTLKRSFSCSWLKHTDVRFFEYHIRLYKGYIRSDDPVLHNAITHTRCFIKNRVL